MKNKGTKQKSKKKGGDDAFGCDLTEHLRSSGRDVPQVLKKCAEFIEEHGVVDGIYRLSGVTSNIQRLRQEFCSDSCPDLTKEVYLQDIHCVGSLCKLYFRELPNPLLTYELYSKFTEAASVQGSHDKLLHIQSVIKELPIPHFRTLEYLTKHLTRLATLSTQTNMHTRNLALVWAPNLLRCKDTDASSCNGDLAFQEVRIQQSVVEFILNHTEQLFNDGAVDIKPKEGMNVGCGEKYATLPLSSQCGPMKLMSLEEAQARSLGPNHPVHKERQRENSLPDTSTATLYHTVIDVDSKRKLSGKSKWKSIFNLGKSVTDSKGKLSRNGSVFIRGQSMTEKAALRPARSMESLCSLPIDDDRPGNISPPSGTNGLFRPEVKSRTLGSDLLYDLSEEDQKWEFKGKNGGSGGGGDGGGGAMGGCSSSTNQQEAAGSSSGTTQKALPEQLKVFKGEDLGGYKPTSPKNRRMLYSGSSSHSSSSRPSFPGSFFPLESSPRHQRKAVNISEPFAVSVPLRVSAVISSNSTPCRGHAKEKPNTVALKPCKETTLPERSSGGGSSSAVPRPEVENQIPEGTSKHAPADSGEKGAHDGQAGADFPQLEPKDTTRKELLSHPVDTQTNIQSSPVGKESWSDLHQELKITEPEIDRMDETFKPIFSCEDFKTQAGVQSRRSCSSPTLYLSHGDPASNAAAADLLKSPVSNPVRRPPSESDVPLPFQLNADFVLVIGESEGVPPPRVAVSKDEKPSNLQQVLKMTPADTEKPADSKHWDLLSKRTSLHIIEQHPVPKPLRAGDHAADKASSLESTTKEELQTHVAGEGDAVGPPGGEKKHEAEIRRAVRPLEDRPSTLELHHRDEDDGCAELDLVEPWEDLSSSKQWVTSPLHSPDIEVTLLHLPGPASRPLSREEGGPASHAPNADGPARANDRLPSGNVSQTPGVEPGAKGTCSQPSSARCNRTDGGATQPHAGRCGAAKHRGTLPSQRFYRQMSQEPPALERRDEACFSKYRPCSLNLDIGRRSIRDISNQQSSNPVESSPCPRGPPTASGAANNGLSLELELFLRDRQAPLRRNSAPVSVSSVRTAFMIKTCQAKAVPVIPPKVQYSQIPHSRLEKDLDVVREQERAYPKKNTEKTALPHKITDLREELENKEPVSSSQMQTSLEKSGEPLKTGPAPDLQVKTRKHTANVDLFVDCPRPSRGNLLQRSSFRNRQRPQSLILLSPPFPIMDYPPLDDSKLHLSPRSLADASAINAFSREMAENLRSPDGITLQNKMTIPKSGQRLETSTSCFYQPQRRSMIFDSRSHRQIE